LITVIVVSSVVGVALIVLLTYCFYCKKHGCSCMGKQCVQAQSQVDDLITPSTDKSVDVEMSSVESK
jgi:hypothetical protein